jgi:hypothetical protein
MFSRRTRDALATAKAKRDHGRAALPPQYRHARTAVHRRHWTACLNSIQKGAGPERRGCANLRGLTAASIEAAC